MKSKEAMKKTQTERGEALRDRFFELHRAPPVAAAAQAFRDEVNALDVEPVTRVNGLRVNHFPTARFKQLRFFEVERLDPAIRDLFARPAPALPHLAAGFVDPQELSLRTFENIVGLDELFDGLGPLSLGERSRFGKKDVYAFRLAASEADQRRLLALDGLPLYVPPLNQGSRGGERFIFHSERLASALTAAVKDGLGKTVLHGFSHVNPVFRCNGFEPGDEKFHEHYDTPYFDPNRKQVSRYTLLLYLTPGTGAPALSVEGEELLGAVPAFTCVVMDQSLAHEGRAYAQGRKVFLRTELIFDAPTLEHDPALSRAFGQAVYLTGESVFRPELERFAEDAYNRVASGHWRGALQAPRAPEPLVHKQFRDTAFVTNGFDFYFPREGTTVEECAAIALLDFLNCEVDGVAFRKACKTKVLGAKDTPASALRGASARAPLTPLDKEALFPCSEEPNSACCPFHMGLSFDPARHPEVLDLYQAAQRFSRARILPAPVLMMGDEVFLDPSRFVVAGDKVHVLSDEALAPVNFAACWNYGGSPESYVGVDTFVTALHPLVPPMSFGVEGGLWHFRLDFFRNAWWVKQRTVEVPVPSLLRISPDDAEEGTGPQSWTAAVGDDVVSPGASQKPEASVWWGDDSPLLRELTANGLKRFHE